MSNDFFKEAEYAQQVADAVEYNKPAPWRDCAKQLARYFEKLFNAFQEAQRDLLDRLNSISLLESEVARLQTEVYDRLQEANIAFNRGQHESATERANLASANVNYAIEASRLTEDIQHERQLKNDLETKVCEAWDLLASMTDEESNETVFKARLKLDPLDDDARMRLAQIQVKEEARKGL